MPDLADLDKAYDAAEVSYGDTLPDGDYIATCVRSYIEPTPWDEAGRQWASEWEAEYTDGEETKRTGKTMKWQVIEAERLGYLKKDMQTLGYSGKLSELEQTAPTFVGSLVEITIKRKQGDTKTFVNVYLNRLVGKTDYVPDAAPAAAADEDEIPF